MSRRGRGAVIFLVATLVVVVCSVVFADAGTAGGDFCGQTHIWAEAKPAPQPGSPLVESVAAPPDIPWWGAQSATGRLAGCERDDVRVPSPAVQSSAPRAPPLV